MLIQDVLNFEGISYVWVWWLSRENDRNEIVITLENYGSNLVVYDCLLTSIWWT